jgi:hypothetical protein
MADKGAYHCWGLRPPATGEGEPVVVRMQPPQLQALDVWIAAHRSPSPRGQRPPAAWSRLGLKAKQKG